VLYEHPGVSWDVFAPDRVGAPVRVLHGYWLEVVYFGVDHGGVAQQPDVVVAVPGEAFGEGEGVVGYHLGEQGAGVFLLEASGGGVEHLNPLGVAELVEERDGLG